MGCRDLASSPLSRRFLLSLAGTLVLLAPGCGKKASLHSPSGPVASAPSRGEAVEAHLTLAGSYQADAKAVATCSYYPDKTLQVTFNVPQKPTVVLSLPAFHGTGTYAAEVRVRAPYSGENWRVSRGPVEAKVTVVAGKPRSAVSGSFQGRWKGEGGEGAVSGTFETCSADLTTPEGEP